MCSYSLLFKIIQDVKYLEIDLKDDALIFFFDLLVHNVEQGQIWKHFGLVVFPI